MSLSLGSNLEASDIKEGDDVYFECNMTANPSATKVTWKKDVRNMYTLYTFELQPIMHFGNIHRILATIDTD